MHGKAQALPFSQVTPSDASQCSPSLASLFPSLSLSLSLSQTFVTKSKEETDLVFSCCQRKDRQGKLHGFVCVGQNMDKLGGPQPQVSRFALARAVAVAPPLATQP